MSSLGRSWPSLQRINNFNVFLILSYLILSYSIYLLFTISFSWANNCAANNKTNGVDKMPSPGDASLDQQRRTRAARIDLSHPNTRISLPNLSQSDLTSTNGSTGVIKSFILPGEKTGVVRDPATLCVSGLTVFFLV